MTNMLKKVFNWSEVHLTEMTCYKIHTLGTGECLPDSSLSNLGLNLTLPYTTGLNSVDTVELVMAY